MNDPLYRKLLEASWRRKLTPAEKAELRAWLKAHPETQADWRIEASLNRGLGRLSDMPVPTNFTSRVVQAVQTRRRDSKWAWPWRFAWVRVGFATALVAGVGLFTYQQHLNSRRSELAQGLEAFSSFDMVPSPDALKDYPAILHLGSVQADSSLYSLGLTTP